MEDFVDDWRDKDGVSDHVRSSPVPGSEISGKELGQILDNADMENFYSNIDCSKYV